MPRQHVKVYINDDWLDLMHDERGERTLSAYVKHCIMRELLRSKDVGTRYKAKQLPEVKPGRPY